MRGAGSRAARRLITGCLLLALPLAAPAGAAALGAPGQLDPTFHGGKPVLEDLAKTVPHFTDFNNLLVDGAGRIVVAGQTTDPGGHTAVALARFSANGEPDPGFGEGGFRVTQFGAGPSPYSTPQSLFTVPGRYVGFGIYRIVNGRSDLSADVLGENGAGDPGFGKEGLATVDWPPSPDQGATGAAAAAPDGTVYVSGTTTEGGTQHALEVAKFTPQGQLGENFPGLIGVYTHRFGEAAGLESTGGPIATLSDSSMVIAGSASMASGGNGLLLVHLSEGGQLDSSFGQHAGYSIINISDPKDPNPYAAPIDILVGPQGEIYVAGIGDDASGQQAAVIARFSPSGQPDFTFGNGGGIDRIQLGGPGQRSAATNLALQPDGKIIVMASVDVEGTSHPRILRLKPNGELDPTFGNGGIVVPDLGGEETFLGGAAVVGNRLLVSGSVKGVGGYSGALAAYLLESLPDPAPIPGPNPGQGTIPKQAKGTLRPRKKSFAVDAKGRVGIPLACSAAGPCQGLIALLPKTGKVTLAKTKKATPYAKATYKLPADARTTVTLTLSKRIRAQARSKRGLSARLAIAPQGGATQTSLVKLRR